jgi:hypothetical protein
LDILLRNIGEIYISFPLSQIHQITKAFHLNAEIQKKVYIPPFAGPFSFLSIFSLYQSYVAEGQNLRQSGCSAGRTTTFSTLASRPCPAAGCSLEK